jgi:siroheme synthase-like protein
MLDVSERLAVVVGGGPVAARKARGLIEAGCGRIRVVAPRFTGEFPTGIEKIVEAYQAKHLDGAGIVFAATDSAFVNEAVVTDAKKLNVLCTRADIEDENVGDFSNPAVYRAGPVVISVSAGGSPTLAVGIRDQVAGALDPTMVKMAEAMQALRPMILGSRLGMQERRNLFRSLAGEEAIEILSRGGLNALKLWIGERYPVLRDGLGD